MSSLSSEEWIRATTLYLKEHFTRASIIRHRHAQTVVFAIRFATKAYSLHCSSEFSDYSASEMSRLLKERETAAALRQLGTVELRPGSPSELPARGHKTA